MRLIDADGIEYESVAIEERGGFRATDIVEQKDIDEMPTIEAIPIEWIEEWYKKKADKPFVADDVSVRLLLRDWREEQC